MKPLMPPIDTPDQVFHDGDPSTGELGTICSAEWLNNVQGNIRNIQAECIAILKATGFTPDSTNDGQLWEAIQAAIKSQVPAATVTTAGITQLSSSVTSDSETIAATSKAVKIAMDNASARLAKDRNLADLPNVPLALQNLTLAATKKAIEDTQTGLSAQPVMRINSADDLSNLPAGARRFAINNTGVLVLPSVDYCYIEVLAKRDTANGSCIKIVEYSNPGNAWTGTRNNVPADAAFTWVRQYNESYRPPQQAMPDMPDALIRGNNLSDLTDPAAGVRNLGLTDTVNKASHIYSDGDVYGTYWGGYLSSYISRSLTPYVTSSWANQTFIRDVRMGTNESAVWGANGGTCPPGYVLTGGDFNDNQEFPVYAPVQKNINGIWHNVMRA